jgi:AcrR family transcriptional regulator
LEVTRQLVTEQGAGISMADVAAAAGVSRQSVYLHFRSRANLFVAVVRHMDAEADIRRRCEQALAVDDPVEALRAFLLVWLRYAEQIHPTATALLASHRDNPDAAAAWNDRMAELRAGFRAAARRLAGAGRLRAGLDAAKAGDLAWAMASMPVFDQLTVDCRWTAGTARRHLVTAVTSALTEPVR